MEDRKEVRFELGNMKDIVEYDLSGMNTIDVRLKANSSNTS